MTAEPTQGLRPTSTTAPTPTSFQAAAGTNKVAIARANGYDLDVLRPAMSDMFDKLGGIGDIIRPGARVAIKINMTGGSSAMPYPDYDAISSYITHPFVVRVLCELLRDAGATRLYIVEGIWEQIDIEKWGFDQVARLMNADVIDLNQAAPYKDFGKFNVGKDAFIYRQYTLNHILEEIDAFISVPKMKCHATCGVTHAMKNLVGIAPLYQYNAPAGSLMRDDLHGTESERNTRLPRAVVDLNRARPVQLALIDGIKTVEGGEGPWVNGMQAVEPNLLIAGKNAVSTDAVATAVMGFKPTAEYPTIPFLNADNYLNLACEMGLGTNIIDEIEVLGAPIKDVVFPFKPV